MKKLNWNPKVLLRGISTLISDALSVIYIVVLDIVQKGSIDTPTLTKSGYVSSDGVPLTTQNNTLTHAFILDTEGDVFTKIGVRCNDCGNELEVTSVDEQAEIAIILTVGVCENCKNLAHETGYHKCSSEYTQGY